MLEEKHHRILVCGAGSIGARHARNLIASGRGDVTLWDPDTERLRAFFGECLIDTSPTYEEALRATKPDVVFICSPSKFHIPNATEGAQAGCHLFIEKPLSHTLEGIDALSHVCEEKRLITMVGCNMRFHPGPKKVKELLGEGTIGPVIAARIETGSYLPSWRAQQDYRRSYSADPAQGGVLLDCIHEIDLALWYFGPATLRNAVVLPATSIGLRVDGLAELLVQHASGTLSSIHLNFIQRNYKRRCELIGERGSIIWDFEEKCVRLFGEDGTLRQSFPEPAGWGMNRMYVDELEHFFGCIERGMPTFSSITDGKAALDVALEARKSA